MADIDYLKRNVFPGESGGDYNALFGYSNRPGGQFAGVNLTDLTVDQALAFADPSGPYGQWVKGQVGRVATPLGAYQIVGTTLRGAKEGLGLTGSEKMTPELQDQLGMWIYQNQGPGAWEAWGKGGGSVTASSKGGAPMGLLDTQMEDDRGGVVRLLTGEAKPWAGRLNDLGAVLLALSGSPAAGPLLEQMGQRRAEKKDQQATNRTAAWLRAQGRDDLAAAIESGAISGKDAAGIFYTPAEQQGQVVGAEELRKMYPGERIEDGLYSVKPDGTISKVGGGGTTVNLPGQPTIGTIPPGYQAVQGPDGRYTYEPIPGGPAAAEVGAAEKKNQAFADTASDSIGLIDSVINDPALPSVTGMIQGRIPPLTQAGTDLVAKIEQIQGQAFVQAFESLKGGGAITDREGIAAQNAIARLQRSQSPEAYKQSLNELKAILERGRQRALSGNLVSGGGAAGGGATVIDGVTVGEGF